MFCQILALMIFLMGFSRPGLADFRLTTFNTKHLGRDSGDPQKIAAMIAGSDFVALQEVNTGDAGAKALAKVSEELGLLEKTKFCFALSEIPTDAKERYGAIWREDKISYVTQDGKEIGECPKFAITLRLGAKHADKIIREPAVGTFKEKAGGAKFVFATIHLIPTAKHPETEVEPLFDTMDSLPGKYAKLIVGDFNLASNSPSFANATRRGFKPALSGEVKTSLKLKLKEYSQAYDNIFYRGCTVTNASVGNPYLKFPALTPSQVYRQVSDHAPVSATITLWPLNPTGTITH
jgi:endonuclease/exonuclease/phosphatase family metal-dependent hydrolase